METEEKLKGRRSSKRQNPYIMSSSSSDRDSDRQTKGKKNYDDFDDVR